MTFASIYRDLAGRDQTLVRRLYETLRELLHVLTDTSTTDEQKWEGAARWSQLHDLEAIIDRVREIGLASYEQNPGERFAQALHDVRGGALSPLLGRLQLLEHLPRGEAELKAIFVLTRDHLKIMRNAVVGLDEVRRNADRKPKVHAMQLMLDKWQESVVGPRWDEGSLRLHIDCRYEGPLTECCLESAAIDRIFYNAVHHASRYAVGQRIDLTIFPVPGAPDGGCVRFVLAAGIDADYAARLHALEAGSSDSTDRGHGRSLFALFEPESAFSDDADVGLAVVADFVAIAFGLRGRAEALRERYVGAILDGRTLRLWFHWPLAHVTPRSPRLEDDFHRPSQSLSEG